MPLLGKAERLLKSRSFRYLLVSSTLILAFVFGPPLVLRTGRPWGVVNGGSMNPTFHDGDILLIRGGLSAEEVNVGDVIVFHKFGGFICHRVINKTYDDQLGTWVFQTKGDGNHQPDPWLLLMSDIEGKVILRIPGFGPILLLISLSATIFLITVTFTFIYTQRRRRRLKTKP